MRIAGQSLRQHSVIQRELLQDLLALFRRNQGSPMSLVTAPVPLAWWRACQTKKGDAARRFEGRQRHLSAGINHLG